MTKLDHDNAEPEKPIPEGVGQQDNAVRWRVAGLRQAVEGAAGYHQGLALEPAELDRVRKLISRQWLSRLRERTPQQAAAFGAVGIAGYHQVRPLVDHAALWPKAVRILPREAVAEIRQMSLFRRLEQAWGAFAISDEENVGSEEIYWRIVRPDEPADVGPLHADCWFWELGHGNTPSGVDRVKVWIGVYCEPERNGLRIVPGSHLHNWRYHGVTGPNGMVKPQIDEDENVLRPQLVPLQPGEAIVFHDRLLHGGAVNRGDRTRVSIEFTMLVSRENASSQTRLA